jgi:isopentenyldiphosphate isomerase
MRIPIVNEEDEIICYKERENTNPEDIVRATGLWIKDKDGNILLSQRSLSKKFGPGLWGPAAGGVVEEGETCESCIIREAEEEIGLRGVIFNSGPKIRLFDCFGYFFTATVDSNYEFVKQDEEVEQIKWFSQEELNKLLKEKPEIFMKGFEEYIKILK